MAKEFVIGDFNAEAFGREQAARERELYIAACAGDDGAAAALHFWQATFGALEAKDVDDAMREGDRSDRLRLAGLATWPNLRHGTEWHQLQAFGIAARRTRPKSTPKLLELRHAFGQMLTADDLRAALTTEYAVRTKKVKKPKTPREDWPETVDEVERELVAYVRHHYKGTQPEAALAYVRDSFPGMQWNQPDELVDYPPHW